MRSQRPITNCMSCSISRMVEAELVAQPADQLAQLLLLGGVHARGRLVEQQQLGRGRERARDLEPPLLAVGQRVGAGVRARARGPGARAGRARAPRARSRRRARPRRAARRAAPERSAPASAGAHVVERASARGTGGCSGTCARRRGARSRAARARRSAGRAGGPARSSARRRRVITLKTVVLPAPLGPISATSSPGSTPRSRPDSAVSPPKRTLSASSSRRSTARSRPARQPRQIELAVAEQTLRPQQHARDQQQRVEDHAPLAHDRAAARAVPSAPLRRRSRR